MVEANRKFAEIEVREGLSAEEFNRQYVAANRPVILKGGATRWSHRWTPEILKERFGDRILPADGNQLFQNNKISHSLRFGDILDSIISGSLEYRVRVATQNLLKTVPELAEDLEREDYFQDWFPGAGKQVSTFWISPPNNTTVMHHDTYIENLNAQIHGRKTFVMIPPSDTRRVYPHFMSESPINPWQVDTGKFPAFADASVQEGTLEPGDVLYIPQFWWHTAKALEPTINVTFAKKATRSSMTRVLMHMPMPALVVYEALYSEGVQRWLKRNERRLHRAYVSLLRKNPQEAAR
jgi:peptidyl-lysine (3S)-dioxygenase / protease